MSPKERMEIQLKLTIIEANIAQERREAEYGRNVQAMSTAKRGTNGAIDDLKAYLHVPTTIAKHNDGAAELAFMSKTDAEAASDMMKKYLAPTAKAK